MTDRIIDIAEKPSRLRVNNGLLVIEGGTQQETNIPLSDIGVLVVSHPVVTYTQAVLSGLAVAGGTFVVCDEKRMPVGMILPLAAHSTQCERFEIQATVSVPKKKRVWQQIVRAKIRAQARLLKRTHGDDQGLFHLSDRVRSGDPENLEAQASRRYWPALFGSSFTRNPEAEDQNAMLNYGYGVLRAIVCRALCAAGLHPGLGIHHHNRYDAFPLADDMMEPYRPVVDGAVWEWSKSSGQFFPLERPVKDAVLSALTGRFDYDGEARTLFDFLSHSASSLVAVFSGERKEIFIPEL